MRKKKLTRKMKIERNKSGKMSDNSTYSRKKRQQRRGIFNENSPFKSV
jgi:stalled ribosome alternative rescue factor ArfA